MVNHFRTLLLNRAASYFTAVPASEYIDPQFVPLSLPAELQDLRDAIIPNGIDKFAENYIANVLMTIAQQPELYDYVTTIDPRLTYNSQDVAIADLVNPNVTLSVIKSSSCDVSFKYVIQPTGLPMSMGQSGRHVWYINRQSADEIKITGTRTSERIVNIKDASNPYVSKRIDLLTGYLSVYFLTPSGSLTGAFTATYDTLVAPPYDLSVQIELLKDTSARMLGRLFSSKSYYSAELKDLLSAYVNSPEALLKVGCALVAYILQCDILMRGART